jgi:hypothetical protein
MLVFSNEERMELLARLLEKRQGGGKEVRVID